VSRWRISASAGGCRYEPFYCTHDRAAQRSPRSATPAPAGVADLTGSAVLRCRSWRTSAGSDSAVLVASRCSNDSPAIRRGGRVVSRLPLRCAEKRLFADGLTRAAPAGATRKPAPNRLGNRVLREPVANQRLRRWVPLRAVLLHSRSRSSEVAAIRHARPGGSRRSDWERRLAVPLVEGLRGLHLRQERAPGARRLAPVKVRTVAVRQHPRTRDRHHDIALPLVEVEGRGASVPKARLGTPSRIAARVRRSPSPVRWTNC
jgi:hypothetical protein